MDSLASQTPKEPISIEAPILRPRKKLVRKPVFLSEGMWAQLDECTAFQDEVFAAMGEDEKVSRNDIIAAFLDWAVKAYWNDKGGKPGSATDRTEKVDRYAQYLKSLQSSEKK